jgi:hypothetical protein
MKIFPVGAELFHADRRTDMTKRIVAFLKFTKAPVKEDCRIGIRVKSHVHGYKTDQQPVYEMILYNAMYFVVESVILWVLLLVLKHFVCVFSEHT